MVAWRSVAEATGEDMAPAFAVRITDAFETQVRVRVHDGVQVLDDEASRSPSALPRPS